MYQAINKKDDVGKAYDYVLPWRIFSHRINKSKYFKSVLLSQQGASCPVCQGDLQEVCVLHHTDYDHVCQFGVEIQVPTGNYSRTGKERIHNVPDCESCHKVSPGFFESCRSRLILVHRECHGTLHNKSKRRCS